MAPSKKDIEAALRNTVEQKFKSDRENLTVRFVRERVESDLDLGERFFVSAEWKEKSKALIKEWVEKMLNADSGDELEAIPNERHQQPKQKAAPVKNNASGSAKKGTKRTSPGTSTQPKKRQKKEATPSDISDEERSEVSEGDTAESEFDDSDASEAPKSRKKGKPSSKAPGRRQLKAKSKPASSKDRAVNSDDDGREGSEINDEDSEPPSPPLKRPSTPKKPPAVRKPKKAVVDSDEEDAKATDATSDEEGVAQTKQPHPNTKSTANDSESEMSEVLDDTPKTKRKRSKSDGPSKGSGKASKSSKPAKDPKSEKQPSASEEQIKTLQSHLLKCGVRKIWQFELKSYGDDNKAKIRHLQGMLKDIGMTGRFSLERAREIKEQRELMADLEAVKEGDKNWGEGSGRGARSRSVRKSLKESSVESEEEEEVGAETKKPVDKAARMRAEFDFLGDDDESDSD